MSLETEVVLDRRRMRRRLALWRSVAIVGLAVVLGLLAFGGGRLAEILAPRQIARVSIEGTITDNRAQLKLLKKVREAEHVKAVLIFVNSPGGTTAGGESLYSALREVAKVKPVVAQFGTVAASAGYIVGLGTDHIVARGNTITGSIGVLAQWPEVSELMNRMGVKLNEVKSGDLKAEPTPFKPASEGARRVMQETIDDGFTWFLSLVEKRRSIESTSVAGLRDGRIFSGRQALKHKLIDEIGGEPEAVRWLEEYRGIEKELEVVDWKPSPGDALGLTGQTSRIIASAGATGLAALVRFLSQNASIGGLGLDGLVSVWQPSEN
jgi:protease IV